MRFGKTLTLLMLAIGLVLALSAGAQQRPLTQDPERKKALSAQDIGRLSFPSVVLLVTQDDQGQPLALGSGFFVRPGIIATNFHVIEGAARAWAKPIGQKGKYEIQGNVGVDTEKDLALLKVENSTEPPLVLGNSDEATVGDTLFVVGNPRGLEGTLSEGIVSAVRTVAGGKLLQITAPLSPGSSGGPVINTQGQVIGVAAATVSGGQNLNFAIPTSYLRTLLGNTGSVRSLTANPVRSAENSLLGRVGHKPVEGVSGAQFIWAGESTGWFTFSIRNELSRDVTHVRWLVIFYGPDSKPIDSREDTFNGTIRACLAARISGPMMGSDVVKLATERDSQDHIVSTRATIRILDFEFADDSSDKQACERGTVLGPETVSHPANLSLEELPATELSKLDGTCQVSGSLLQCEIYNGSGWRVQEILVHITVKEREKKKGEIPVLSRQYTAVYGIYKDSQRLFLDPASSGTFNAYLGFSLGEHQHFEWNPVSAQGRPPAVR